MRCIFIYISLIFCTILYSQISSNYILQFEYDSSGNQIKREFKNNLDCDLANEKAFNIILEERNYDKALKFIQNCQDQKSLYLRSKIHFKQENYVDALKIMNEKIKLADDDHVSYFYQAILNLKIGDILNYNLNIDKSLEILQKKISKNKYSNDDLLNYSFYFMFKTSDKNQLYKDLKCFDIQSEELTSFIEELSIKKNYDAFFEHSF